MAKQLMTRMTTNSHSDGTGCYILEQLGGQAFIAAAAARPVFGSRELLAHVTIGSKQRTLRVTLGEPNTYTVMLCRSTPKGKLIPTATQYRVRGSYLPMVFEQMTGLRIGG